MELVVVQNPFNKADRTTETIEVSIATLQQIADEQLNGALGMVGSINGEVIPRDSWYNSPVKNGDCVVFVPFIGEGEGKSILNVVAMVALMYVAGPMGAAKGLAGLFGASSEFAIMTAYVAIVVSGGLVISALTPHAKTPETADYTQSYSWSPHSTQQQGISIPRYYGKSRVYGNVINVYTDVNSSDETKEQLNMLIALGRGPVKGITSGTLQLNDIPYTLYDSVTVDERRGLLSQTAITLFSDTRAQYALNRTVSYGTPVTYTTPNSDYDDVEVAISFPRGIAYANSEGGLSTHNIGLKIEIRNSGGTWHTLVETSVSAATTESMSKIYLASGTYTGGSAYAISNGTKYEVRITKTTADQTSMRYADKLTLSSVREIFSDGFTYPRTALVGVSALATDELSGTFNFSAVLEGLILAVYNGSVWSLEYSSNPAWVLWDVLTQPVISGDGDGTAYEIERYEGIDPSRLDLEAFYELAEFCDDLVPDGNGGTEKRIEFNGGFDSEMSMWDAVVKVCEVARCAPVWKGTTITLAIDKSSSVVQLFSSSNIDTSSFKETFLSLSERVSEVEVQFFDEEQDYAKTTFSVIDDQVVTPTNKTTLNLLGVTKSSAAWRAAMYRLAQNRLATSVIEFDVDIDALAVTIGDVIIVQSSVPNWGMGGRVVASGSLTVTLDADYTMSAGDKIFVRTYNPATELETIQEKTVVSVADRVVTISTAWTVNPNANDVYAIGSVNSVGRKFRVIGLSRTQDEYITITATDYSEDIYNYDDSNPIIQSEEKSEAISLSQNIIKPIDYGRLKELMPSSLLFKSITTNIDIPLVSGLSSTNDSPSAGSVTWSAFKLTYKGVEYNVVTGYTSNAFIYWDKNSAPTTLHSTNTLTTAIGVDKFVICVNAAGAFYLTPGFLTLHGGLIQAGTITASGAQIADATITNAKIADAAITSAKIGNLEVKTANIENLTVNGDKIANNTTHIYEMQNNTASYDLGNHTSGAWVYSKVAEVTITSLGGVVEIKGGLTFESGGSSDFTACAMQIRRGSTVLYYEYTTVDAGGPDVVVPFNLIDVPGAGSFTYSIYADAQYVPYPYGSSCKNRMISVKEYKGK